MKKATIVRSITATSTVLFAAIAFLAMTTPVSAWSVNHSASSICKDESAAIKWSFKNTEPNQPRWSIDLTVTNTETNAKVTKTVKSGESINGIFMTNRSKIDSGKVSFKMLWTDGRGGIDTRHSTYAMTEECYTPEQPAFNAAVICSIVDEKAVFTLRVTQTAGDIDGVFTPKNGDTVATGDSIDVLGVFNTAHTSEKIVVKTASVEDCSPDEEVSEIKVCRDGKIITINESDKRSTDTDVCPVTKVEKPKTPQVLATVTELPKTGAGAIAGILGSVFASGTAAAHVVLRRK